MMDPMFPSLVNGDSTVVGWDVMGNPIMGAHLRGLPHHKANPAQARQLLGLHQPHWRAAPMAAPGVSMPHEMRKVLPLKAESGGGVFAAVTDRIRYSARPQKAFNGERLLIDYVKTGANALATRIRASQFAVGTTSQLVELGDISLEHYTSQSLDMNIKMDPVEPGGLILIDVYLSGPAFVPGTDSINLVIEILGRSMG